MLLYSKILGEGKPLLILHGFLGMSDNWKTLGNQFAENGYEVHLIDQRNHGRSFHSDDFSYEFLVHDLKFYCDHYNLKNVNIIGHSMGGKTAMLFATTYPDLVSKLLVADIAPRYYPAHHQYILDGLAALNFDLVETRKQADEALSDHVEEIGIRMFLLKNMYRTDKNGLGLRLNLRVLQDNVEEIGEALPSGSGFNGNTLFLRGDRSEYITLADEAIIKTHFPHANIKTVKNAGHWLHAENPKEFMQKALVFFEMQPNK